MNTKKAGDSVNLEFDILGKYVQKQLLFLHETMPKLSEARLKELGY
jgi:riboflavin synthase alpha subunit